MRKAALATGRKMSGISPAALDGLKAYAWPDNIRQLEWAMERAVVLGESEWIDPHDLPPEILQRTPVAAPSASQGSARHGGGLEPVMPEASWEEHEKAKILEALERSSWNITQAARLLGMTFRTLQYRLDKFGIKRP